MALTLSKDIILKAKAHFLSLEELVYLYGVLTHHDYGVEVSVDRLRMMNMLDKNGEVTPYATTLFEIPISTVTKYDADFEDFWSSFPANDAHGGFHTTRKFKPLTTKRDARNAYIRARQRVSHEDILEALKMDVQNRIRESSRHNELSYLKSPKRWLDEEEYLNIENIDDEGQGYEIE